LCKEAGLIGLRAMTIHAAPSIITERSPGRLAKTARTATVARARMSSGRSEKGNLCSQTTIDCWAKIPAIAPCDDAWVTEGKKGVVRSPAA